MNSAQPTWSSGTLATIDVAKRRADALTRLTEGVLPAEIPGIGRPSEWPLCGWAMLARACSTLNAVLDLAPPRRVADAAVLTRTLFEELVIFAWVAIDPDEHPARWVRWDRRQRIKADNDLQDKGLDPLLTPQARAAFEAEVAAGDLMPDNLIELTLAVDAHWSTVSTIFQSDPKGRRSFRGMYRHVYRNYSQYVHAGVGSLDRLITPGAQPRTLQLSMRETDPGAHSPFTLAPTLHGLGLFVAEYALGVAGIEPELDRIFSAD